MDVTKVGGLGDSALLDNVVTPQQDRQSASKLQGFTGAGAGRPTPGEPRNAQKKSGGIRNDGACDPGEGGGEGGVGGVVKVTQGARVRKGKGGAVCMPWKNDERVALFECYQRTGGVRKGGFIKKTKEEYDKLDLAPRSEASLIAQLNWIEGGAISRFDRDEIKKRVQSEIIALKVKSGVGLEKEEIDQIFGESFDEECDYRDFLADASL